MLQRRFSRCMLKPADLTPMREQTRVVGAFNPGAAAVGDGVVLLVRVVEEVIERRDGYLPSPRIDPDRNLVVDWLSADEISLGDPRLYTRKRDGRLRLRFISHLKVVRSKDGKSFDDLDGREIMPNGEYEEYGIEDPRITKIGETYYITYVGVSRHGVTTRLMSTTDFDTFQHHGIVFCPDNKDVVLFPEKIMGSYVAMHRPMPSMKFSTPQIWLARSPDLIHWGSHEQIIGGTSEGGATSDRIGGGTPPIRTERGWLTIYHGADKSPDDPGVGIYSAGALLLDLQDPRKIVGHTASPIMVPTEPFETRGFVDNVVFPTAVVERDDHYLVYYGATDENLGVTAFDKDALLGAL